MKANLVGLVVLVFALVISAVADARPRLLRPFKPRGGSCFGGSCSVASAATSHIEAKATDSSNVWHPLALARARACADRFAVGHWLGCPAGCYEGAGSGSTEDQAIQNCCFWGQRKPRAIATVQRGMTWFAVVLYE